MRRQVIYFLEIPAQAILALILMLVPQISLKISSSILAPPVLSGVNIRQASSIAMNILLALEPAEILSHVSTI